MVNAIRWRTGSLPALPCALAAYLLAVGAVSADQYTAARSSAVSRCEAIDPADYQSGLLFNPDGYRSFYVRSQCLQSAAIQFRDESLCTQVRQRRSLFSSSWGYSPSQCRKLVAEGITADRAAIAAMKALYDRGAVQLRSFRIEPNGNGRDFDIVLAFSGGYAHGYRLEFEIVDAGPPVLVHSDGYYLDATSQLRIYVRQADLRARFPGFALDHRYRVRGSAVLDIGTGGPAGSWSEAFIDSAYPAAERTRSLTIDAVFASR